MADQQKQTLEYLKVHADDWNRKSTDEAYTDGMGGQKRGFSWVRPAHQ